MLTEIWTLFCLVVLLRTDSLVKLMIGLIGVIRAERTDLPKIVKSLGRWFSKGRE